MSAHSQESGRGLVFIIDDDQPVLTALARLIMRAGHEARGFGSAEAFLEDYEVSRPACVLMDVRLPGMSGPLLQAELQRRRIEHPVVVMSGQVDVRTAVRMMRAGAVDLLHKPFTADALLARIEEAMELDRRRAAREARAADLRDRLQTLSAREEDVLKEVLAGRTTKQISAVLNIGIQTVAKHKARALRKLGVKSDLEALLLLGEGPRAGAVEHVRDLLDDPAAPEGTEDSGA